ncbi:MAG: hypothetical protein QW184_01290 [Nanopusillaceae archaeon]
MEEIKLVFKARIVTINNKNYLRIQCDLSDTNLIKKIVDEILKNGYCKINGVIVFNNPLQAISRLKQANLL